MVAQPDYELVGNAVIDEESLQDDVDEVTFDMMGDSTAVEESQELDEERNEKLGVVSRGLTRFAPAIITVAAILSTVIVILRTIANVFDISFTDVRNAIVNVLDSILQAFTDVLPSTSGDVKQDIAGNIPSVINPSLGISNIGASLGQSAGQNLAENSGINLNLDLLTSRDQMLGDSTQQDKSADKQNQNIFNWGS